MSSAASTPLTNGQNFAQRLAEFRVLRGRGALCTAVTEPLALKAAEIILNQFQQFGNYPRVAVTLLTEISTLEDPCLAEPGLKATFPLLIEKLCDSFDPASCALYDRVVAQMISECRNLPIAKRLDSNLRKFGLNDESDLLQRKTRLVTPSKHLAEEAYSKVHKVLVLSRITLGADIAVTSIVVQMARNIFPNAEIILISPAKASELFGGDASLRIHPITYHTHGGLVDRLQNWLPVLEAVNQEIHGLDPSEFIIIDPDSRLLQLGFFPVVQDESRYFFFESRAWTESADSANHKSISDIASDWFVRTLGGASANKQQISPAVFLRENDRMQGRKLVEKLRDHAHRRIVAISFGDGGNPAKRAADPFEQELLLHLLQNGCSLVLDKGFGEEEASRANRLLDVVTRKGFGHIELNAGNAATMASAQSLPDFRILSWQGGIGVWAGLIAASDEYIGYDSAGQHIAATLPVPVIDLFVDASSPLFRQRWRPSGRGVIQVVDHAGRSSDAAGILKDVIEAHQQIAAITGVNSVHPNE
ncbi:MAG: hypothetical protein A3F68_06885 [Acidobacteria bacterium RIFCSPLOWO2_12_FULL_54_10]|nr:MAG: hypothetical protein A3F68_06885 [Acidobacteria bacterium RIFCSPLOWO2_12_FULL_54_10]